MNKRVILLLALLPLSAELSAAQSSAIQGVLRFHGNIVERTCEFSAQESLRLTGTETLGSTTRKAGCQAGDALRSVSFSSQEVTRMDDIASVRELWSQGVVVITHE